MYKFELVNARCVESYVKLKKNQNQITWKWKKVIHKKWAWIAQHEHWTLAYGGTTITCDHGNRNESYSAYFKICSNFCFR